MASIDIVTVKVSGIYKKQSSGETIGYFSFLESSLNISNVHRMKRPIISGPSVIGNCGDQTISTFSFSNFAKFRISSNIVSAINYVTTDTFTGVLKITKLDTQQKIISGTFWFDAVNAAGEKVEVREGRFDMRYTN